MGPGSVLFPTNPDLADILGDTDFNFDNFNFLFLVPRFPDRAWAGLGGMGQIRAGFCRVPRWKRIQQVVTVSTGLDGQSMVPQAAKDSMHGQSIF